MNAWIIRMRSIARRYGLLKRFRSLFPDRQYEDKFARSLLSAIRPGDVVWDLGANVGFYTQKFSEIVQSSGVIVAVEPAPASARRLLAATQGSAATVVIIERALGNVSGTVRMAIASDSVSPANHVIHDKQECDAVVYVEMISADDLYKMPQVLPPNVIKIDVEGFELDCIEGMQETLASPQLRSVFVEVHFGLLENRGQKLAPLEIVRVLNRHGFQTRWIDASHLHGNRD